ncbi:MAG TPA: cytochrome P450 [Candidatus Acidoferrales bacterium]|nr:cytochrome P450 [Candidatus Acidoferrales bacterium]
MPNVIPQERKLLFTPEILQDPYPTYARLHAEGPLHYLDVGGNGAAVWSIFGHAECSAIAKDPRLSAKRAHKLVLPLPLERQSEFKELAHLFSLWMIFMDAPEHTRLRKLLNKGFAPGVIEALRPQVEAIVDRMLSQLRPGSETELAGEFANPLPVRIILELLGIPQELNDMLVDLSRAVAGFRGTPTPTVEQAQVGQAALVRLNEFFRTAVAERRRNKGNDLISLLIDIEEQGEVLTEDELFAQCTALLFAGHETTRNLIGNGMYTLLRNPDQMAELRDHPEIIRSAVEELLRYESPVQFTSRVLKEDMEICGRRIPRNWSILCMLGAANRDPKQFDNPDRLNLKRTKNEHLAFSAGPHFCIGNQLARMEGQVALMKLVQRFPQMRLTGPRPEWAPTFGFRGLKALRVTL